MAHLQANQVVIPLLKGHIRSDGRGEAGAFLGSATIIHGLVCTCAHVVRAVEPANREVILAKWNPHVHNEPWVIFHAKVHPKYDFAVLLTDQKPPLTQVPLLSAPLDMGPQVAVLGFHDDGTVHDERGRTQQVAPRMFSGNVVRTHDVRTNVSATLCELSFPVLSGFSGAPVLNYPGLDAVVGLAYGNAEQTIQVYGSSEVRDGEQVFSETVNRILELGLFHSAVSIAGYLRDMGFGPALDTT